MITKIKSIFKREEFPEKKQIVQPEPEVSKLVEQVNELKIQALAKQVAEQEIIIRRLLELVIMNIEHKDYSRYCLPQIQKVKNLLDKIK
jgi:hypothetical protein